jgi:outer membrane protein assembly factor BamA
MSRGYVFIGMVSALIVSGQSGLTQTSNQSQRQPKILIESVAISGTRSVDSAELTEIADSLAGPEFSEDSDELADRIRNEFQNHGFYTAKVQKLEVKVIDPLVVPKSVRLEAQVDEGPLCRISAIDFTGNHAVSSQELRAQLPIKIGDVFTKSKIAGGLVSMQSIYSSRGFLDDGSDCNSGFRIESEIGS